jgi:hypothetical protein
MPHLIRIVIDTVIIFLDEKRKSAGTRGPGLEVFRAHPAKGKTENMPPIDEIGSLAAWLSAVMIEAGSRSENRLLTSGWCN